MKKNNSIQFWRNFFTYSVIIFHLDNGYHFFRRISLESWNAAYVAIDFFFMVSGYLLYQKVKSDRPYESAMAYTVSRYRQIWPKYLISLACVYLAICIGQKSELSFGGLLLDSFWEIIMLQGIGLGRGWNLLNPTLWFLSVMIICGYFIYYGIKEHEKIFLQLVAPLLMLGMLSLLYCNVGHTDVPVQMEGETLNYPLFRGFTEMMLGVYGAKLNAYVIKEHPMKYAGLFGDAIICLATLISVLWGHTRVDFIVMFLMFFGVALAFSEREEGILTGSLIQKWAEITLELYLVHELFRTYVIPYWLPPSEQPARQILTVVVYLLLVTVAAVALKLAAKVFQIEK